MTIDGFRRALDRGLATTDDLLAVRGYGHFAIDCALPSERASVIQFFIDHGLNVGDRTHYLPGGVRYNDMEYPCPGFDSDGTVCCWRSGHGAKSVSYDAVAHLIEPDETFETGDFSAEISALFS